MYSLFYGKPVKGVEFSLTFLCFESPAALFASQHNLFSTMLLDRAKALFHLITWSIPVNFAANLLISVHHCISLKFTDLLVRSLQSEVKRILFTRMIFINACCHSFDWHVCFFQKVSLFLRKVFSLGSAPWVFNRSGT